MAQYKCQFCYYVYDENKGDAWSGIDPGTEFLDLPEEWVCPVCFSTQAMFEKISDEEFLKDFFERIDRTRRRNVVSM